MTNPQSALLNRILLPGLAFKAVVIGGGYATGRELVEFFIPSGPRGGLFGMALAMFLWSCVCALTFLFAYETRSRDYREFFANLLGKFGFLFEVVYFSALILILSVFGAASGAVGHALFGWPAIVGSLCLVVGIAATLAAGQSAVERLFKYVSILLYGIYGLVLVLCIASFGPKIAGLLAQSTPAVGWVGGGITYASYNIMGAVLIVPVLRHCTSRSDAVIAGLLCGPMAMLPALAFFICLLGFYPAIATEALPSNVILLALHHPYLQFTFQLMIFFALLESSVGCMQSFNSRLEAFNRARGRTTSLRVRIFLPAVVAIGSMYVATSIGLIALIANGYRILAAAILCVFVVPLLASAVARLFRIQLNGSQSDNVTR